MIELTTSELALVAGGDAGFMVVVDDGSLAGTFAAVSQPTYSAVSLSATGSVDVNGEFEATFQLFANNGLPED